MKKFDNVAKNEDEIASQPEPSLIDRYVAR
jgi:hypothetical protein